MRPRAPEPYTTYNLIVYQRQMAVLRKAAHDRRISVAALIREVIDREADALLRTNKEREPA